MNDDIVCNLKLHEIIQVFIKLCLFLIKRHTTNTYGELEARLNALFTSQLMDVSGQIQQVTLIKTNGKVTHAHTE
jgi:hypothetical protein